MPIKLEALKTFCTVAQTGNLADAADRLGRTQSAVSMTLKQLEAHLGRRLFESDRKNRLTPLGAQVFELAQKQLRRLDETVAAIETSARSPGGLLRVVSIPSVAALVFPSVIETLNHRYPALKVELWDADTAQVIDGLTQGVVDVGIASGVHALNRIKQVPLFEDPFGLICAAGHPLARQKARPTLDQVAKSGFVRNRLCDRIDADGFNEAFSDITITVRNTLSLISLVRQRNWTTILPRAVVRIMPDDLAFRRIDGLSVQRSVCALVRERSPLFKQAIDLVEGLRKFDW